VTNCYHSETNFPGVLVGDINLEKSKKINHTIICRTNCEFAVLDKKMLEMIYIPVEEKLEFQRIKFF